jgi:hypothetical protein
MHTAFLMNELNAAIGAEYAAKDEAMQRGLAASRPLSAARLAELCFLGEKMKRAKMVKDDAYLAARAGLRRDRLDFVLPSQPAQPCVQL